MTIYCHIFLKMYEHVSRYKMHKDVIRTKKMLGITKLEVHTSIIHTINRTVVKI